MLLSFAPHHGYPKQFVVLLILNISNQVIDVMLDSLLSLPSPVGLPSTQAHTEEGTYRFIIEQCSPFSVFPERFGLSSFLGYLS